MLEQEMKTFRDSVHGYIKIPVDYVERFVDTEVFQRLRNIEQTGMRVLYPSARHDRFIHSLGTFHLGQKAFFHFKNNIYRNMSRKGGDRGAVIKNNEKINEAFWDKCQFLFEIACLLHDCGHAPFSHTFELYYDVQLPDRKNLKDLLKENVNSEEFNKDFKGEGAPHERMSALLVCTDFRQAITDLIEKYELGGVDVGNPVEFVVRMIIGCKYEGDSSQNQIKNCLIDLLNSSMIDVDSLDYIVRDAKLSGIDNMNVDIDRLLSSLTLVETTRFTNCKFENQKVSANVVDGLLKPEGMEASVEGRCSGELNVMGICHGKFLAGGMFEFRGTLSKTEQEVSFKKVSDGRVPVSVNGIRNEKLMKVEQPLTVDIYGVLDKDIEVRGSDLTFDIGTDASIDLKVADSNESKEGPGFGMHSVYIEANLSGVFSGTLVGSFTDIQGGRLQYSLGYHKSSLSVIQNVITARNYEYQWIYSHHKVLYYSNYLLIDLLRNCIRFLQDMSKNSKKGIKRKKDRTAEGPDEVIAEILSCDVMMGCGNTKHGGISFGNQEFLRPTDADIIAFFKKVWLDERLSKETLLYRQLNEYYTRKYKKSLWKSYAEFSMFFSGFTKQEVKKIFDKLVENSHSDIGKHYGYFENGLKEAGMKFGLQNVVWVNGAVKQKTLKPDEVYVLFEEGVFTYRTISSSNDIRLYEKTDIFYLYYEAVPNRKVGLKGLKAYFRRMLET